MAKDNLERFIQSATYEPERFYIPSSLPSINAVIGNKRGFQSGRVLEIVGKYSTGKTTLANDLMKNAQAQGMRALFIDIERTFHNGYAQSCGVNLAMTDIVRADTAENALSILEDSTPDYGIIVLDSLPALLPKEELDKTYNEASKMAGSAGILTRFFKRIVPLLDVHNPLLVILNQYRANFSAMSRVDKVPYGANSSHHAITWRLELARVENAEDTTTVQCKVTKNKLGKERQICKYDIIYGEGLDIKGDILTKAIEYDIVHVTGKGRYEWNGIKAHGAGNAKLLFDFEQLQKEVLAHVE